MIELLREIELERGVPVELLCAALEEALQDAYRQHASAGEADVIVTVNRETATLELMRRRRVVDAIEDPQRELKRADAPAGYEVGDFLDEPIDLGKFGRLAALTAKRTIAQRVLEHEREAVWAKYRPLQGTIVHGLVQRELHGSIYVVFEDGQEAVLPRSERCPNDRFAVNDTAEAELLGVYKTRRGPALILSRSRSSFVRALFGLPEILAGARRVGYVSVIATTKPLPAAIVSDVRAMLGNERLEIVRWSHDPAELVAQLLPPGSGEVFALAEHRLVIIESEIVTDLQVDLARELTGWNVMSAPPGQSDEVLDEVLAAIAAETPAPSTEIDPDLIRKLEEFAREREENEIV